ncbi:HD-GYP domain-containing protein [Alkaliphilus sp. B6464]|uniref:HD-GYP domain-containing protein n=1 Tax=Alkaliphilus sp. B6464 TaxID=2731219 RepID=UPI001BA687F3|nr:HD domain-containing protein [Alkaliphilus sp. B6464]QUH22142.1 HD domain-containing protein [Alkaliphilus sp. B6464]
MRLAKLNESLSNHKLATAIKSKDGKKLINEGAVLSDKVIERLINSGLNTVYIEDENIDIELQGTLDSDKMAAIFIKLQEVYEAASKDEFNNYKFNNFIRNELLPEIKNEPISITVGQVMDKDDIIQHSINVALLSVKTAITLGINRDKIEYLAIASLMHDIGKILKQKNEKLKKELYEEIGFEFLKRKQTSALVYMTVKFQSEFFDGNGLFKMEGKKQNELIKILSICDYYENLLRTTELMPHECFEKVQSLVNTRFDPEIFDAFRKSLYIYPMGLPVRLNNGVEGVVYIQNKSYPLRPIIKTKNMYYNLLENLSLFIEQVTL